MSNSGSEPMTSCMGTIQLCYVYLCTYFFILLNYVPLSLLTYILSNPIALRMAKTQWSFGHSECNRVNFIYFSKAMVYRKFSHALNKKNITQPVWKALVKGGAMSYKNNNRWILPKLYNVSLVNLCTCLTTPQPLYNTISLVQSKKCIV